MKELKINGKNVKAREGETVLEAALNAGIYIPNLCYHRDLPAAAACRLCIVKIEGMKGFPASCTTLCADGMVVHTDTPEVQSFRKNIIWFILSEYEGDPESSTQLGKVAEYVGIKKALEDFSPDRKRVPVVEDDPLIKRDMNRCILCGRCVSICQEVRKTGVLGFVNRGIDTVIGTSYDKNLKDSACKFCTACVEVCPSGAISDREKFSDGDREKKILPCTNECPAGIDAARYVKLIAMERYQDALEVIREKVPFPEILGYVCDHPCETACRRGSVNEPIAIRALKRFAAESDSGSWRSKMEVKPPTGKKIAVAGSGPAGLTAAWFLKKLGHDVKVFESHSKPGGMMRRGIPSYRLPENVLDREIKEIEKIGVEIQTDSEVQSAEEKLKEGFDAVFLAIGACKGMKINFPGSDEDRVVDGISILEEMNSGAYDNIPEDVLVMGGGNVAVDAARSLLRAGAKRVRILYRRTREQMPALEEEVEAALEEGVEIEYLVNPVQVKSTPGGIEVKCVRMQLGERDSSGRRRPHPVRGSEFEFHTEMLVVAVGQKIRASQKMCNLLDEKGRICVKSPEMSCSVKGVFAGGDAVSGPASVIEAIEAGRKAAASIDRYLGGRGRIDEKLLPEEIEDKCLGREEGFAYRERIELPQADVCERLTGFMPVEGPLSSEEAKHESERCLRCQMRLSISRDVIPPEKGK